MMKRLFCILLSLMMLTAASFALAEDAAVETAAEETTVVEPAAEETIEPVLLVTVNGEEIWSNSDYLQMILSYYLDSSAGASIVLTSAVIYAASLALRSVRK